jgi:hypothetical protein
MELGALNQILKFSAHNRQTSNTAHDSIKRCTSCATEMITETEAAVYRPTLRNKTGFSSKMPDFSPFIFI